MKITKYKARYDLKTNEVVLEGLEMVDAHDGQLRLSKGFLYALLDVIPPMKTAQRPREGWQGFHLPGDSVRVSAEPIEEDKDEGFEINPYVIRPPDDDYDPRG